MTLRTAAMIKPVMSPQTVRPPYEKMLVVPIIYLTRLSLAQAERAA
jgi:hypothetical protein